MPLDQVTGSKPVDHDMSQVPWYSIFWALIAISLNSMAQPAGSVCGVPPYLSFMLRSSPIVCIVDTIYLLVRLVYYYTNSETIGIAHSRLIRLRFQCWVEGIEDEQDQLYSLQHNGLTRAFVFLLTLAQVIKFFSYHGLVWTKVIAAMYLTSFLVIEMLFGRLWSRKKHSHVFAGDREKPIKSSGTLSLSYVSIGLAVAFELLFFGAALRDMLGQAHDTLPRFLGIGIFGSALPFLSATYVVGASNGQRLLDILQPAVLLALLLGIPWAYYATTPQMSAALKESLWIKVVSAGLSIG